MVIAYVIKKIRHILSPLYVHAVLYIRTFLRQIHIYGNAFMGDFKKIV